MNIAFVTLGFQPFRTSGFDISGERLVQALLGDGHSVTVVAARKEPLTEVISHSHLTVYRLPMDKSDWISYAFRASRLLRSLGVFDVVHFWDVHFAYSYPGRFVASLHQSFRQRRSVLNGMQSSYLRVVTKGTYYFLSRWLAEHSSANRAAGLLAVSRATQNEFINNYGIPREKIVLARHGIDIEFFRPANNRQVLRDELGFHGNEPIILFAGFITPRKGMEYLAKAYPDIHPKPKLVIVGKWRDEAYRRNIVSQLNTHANGVIEMGFVADNKMPQIYSIADVYVSPSLVEGFGLPIAEAMACGTPVVAFDSGSISEIVGPGGILIESRDTNGLAHAISHLLQNPKDRLSLAENGRRYIEREFSIQKMLQSTLKAYELFLG